MNEEFRAELEKEYGKVNINITTGEYDVLNEVGENENPV
jgi:uncharacterized protein with GYD domain